MENFACRLPLHIHLRLTVSVEGILCGQLTFRVAIIDCQTKKADQIPGPARRTRRDVSSSMQRTESLMASCSNSGAFVHAPVRVRFNASKGRSVCEKVEERQRDAAVIRGGRGCDVDESARVATRVKSDTPPRPPEYSAKRLRSSRLHDPIVEVHRAWQEFCVDEPYTIPVWKGQVWQRGSSRRFALNYWTSGWRAWTRRSF